MEEQNYQHYQQALTVLENCKTELKNKNPEYSMKNEVAIGRIVKLCHEIANTTTCCDYPEWHVDLFEETCCSNCGALLNDCDHTSAQPPIKKGGVKITRLVIADLKSREQLGIKRYGETLTSHNGRRPLADAYQEALDLVQYLKQKLVEDGQHKP